jgi:hypothetical protein
LYGPLNGSNSVRRKIPLAKAAMQVGALAIAAPSVAQFTVAMTTPVLGNTNESKWHRVNVTDPEPLPTTKFGAVFPEMTLSEIGRTE